MILDAEYFHRWEDEYRRSQPVDYPKNLAIFEALYKEAKELGVLTQANFLERVMMKSRVAKILNEYDKNVSKDSSQNR